MCVNGELIGTCGQATEFAHPRPPRIQTEGLQIGNLRLIISCAVVERPDHHCGDDIVFVSRLLLFTKIDLNYKRFH